MIGLFVFAETGDLTIAWSLQSIARNTNARSQKGSHARKRAILKPRLDLVAFRSSLTINMNSANVLSHRDWFDSIRGLESLDRRRLDDSMKDSASCLASLCPSAFLFNCCYRGADAHALYPYLSRLNTR